VGIQQAGDAEILQEGERLPGDSVNRKPQAPCRQPLVEKRYRADACPVQDSHAAEVQHDIAVSIRRAALERMACGSGAGRVQLRAGTEAYRGGTGRACRNGHMTTFAVAGDWCGRSLPSGASRVKKFDKEKSISLPGGAPAIILGGAPGVSGRRFSLGGSVRDGEIWLLLDSRGMGGIESHVAEPAAGLAWAGRRPRVLFLRDHGPHPLRARLDGAGVAWECAGGGLLSLVRRLRNGRPAVLHTHGYKAGLIGRAAALAAGIPLVSTFHAGERTHGMLALYTAVDAWTSFAGGRIAVSQPILEALPWGATLIENFVGIPAAAPPADPPLSVAFVGRMSPEKGPDLFCALAAAAPGPSYMAFGDGPCLVPCAAAGGAVSFAGGVPSMDGHWERVGLLAVTSRAEGLPLAALEAMARGIPVAAFAVGGLPGAIDDGVDGFLAPAGDVTALAARVSAWAAMPRDGRAAMARAARAKAEARFGRANGTARVLRVYASLRA